MTKIKTCFLIIVMLSIATSDVFAQRGGRGGRGGTEGGGGQRGGRGGGETGGFGGFGGGRGGGGDTGGGRTRGGGGGDTGGRGSFGGGRGGGGDTGGGRTRGGATGGGAPSSFMSSWATRMDANQDGKLDPQELQRIPSQFRTRLEQSGVNFDRTVSVKEFGEAATRGVQQLQRERSGEQTDRGGDRGDRGTQRGRDSRRGATSTSTLFVMPPRIQVIKELSKELKEADSDLDGMIALYEWNDAGMDFEEFFEKDKNEDGFITAAEEQGDIVADLKRFMAKQRLTIVGGTGSTSSSGKLSFSSSPATGGRRGTTQFSKPEDKEKGDSYAKAMDKDGDGTINKEEWAASKRLRPWFEKEGIKVESMSNAEFTKNYERLVSKMREDSENRKSSRGGGR